MRNGLVLVELMVAMSILSVTMGLSLFLFHQSSALFQETDITCHLTARELNALTALRQDLRETGLSSITRYSFSDPNFSGTQHSWAMASARDSDGIFQTDGSNQYRADWQAVVVYCLYETSGGARQLRRYVWYGSFSFPFTFTEISESTI